ncbi:MAG: hypothetical protein HY233_04600 [Acidobacteriales bacterium]|nr:hypothetical protein [Terriglobales bacterium]
MPKHLPLMVLLVLCLGSQAFAQDNYEIQVYDSETVPRGVTMLEFHSNFTVEGRKQVENGVAPTHHSLHETLEITHGFTPWFEVGFYVFSSIQPDSGWNWVGDHVRPRITAPESWHLPVGLSLSQEIGYQRRKFSEDSWTYELRPIVDKKIGRWYLSFNPAFGKSIHGLNQDRGFDFSPNAKVSFDFTKKITGGLEYYGGLGPVPDFDKLSNQSQQFFPSIDLNLSPKWEFNFGAGVGVTRSTDRLILKFIIGRRFSWGGERKPGLGKGQPPSQKN